MTGRAMEVAAFTGAGPAAARAYARDGVVCLRGALAPSWIARARRAVAAAAAHPGRFFRDHTPPDSRGRYLFGFWCWPERPALARLALDPAPAGLAGRVLGAREVRMVMDNWFLREAGATNAAPWHHDEPYFDFEGRLAILWAPLEAVAPDEGLVFARGSHRWGRLFVAPRFSDNVPFDCEGPGYEPVPDVEAEVAPPDRLRCALAPGDALLFDFRTLHADAGPPGRPAPRTSRRLTLRYAAEGAVFRPRGPWTRELTEHLLAHGQRPGAPLDCDLAPRVWPPSGGR